MDWKQLVTKLGYRVPAGSVTTYAQAFLWEYGVRNYNQPARSLLGGAANRGHQRLTNLLVGADGRGLRTFPKVRPNRGDSCLMRAFRLPETAG